MRTTGGDCRNLVQVGGAAGRLFSFLYSCRLARGPYPIVKKEGFGRTYPSLCRIHYKSTHTNIRPIDFNSQRSLEGFFGDCGLPEKFAWAEGDWSYTIEERMTEEEREELRRQEEAG